MSKCKMEPCIFPADEGKSFCKKHGSITIGGKEPCERCDVFQSHLAASQADNLRLREVINIERGALNSVYIKLIYIDSRVRETREGLFTVYKHLGAALAEAEKEYKEHPKLGG